jgi:hypothetical protein
VGAPAAGGGGGGAAGGVGEEGFDGGLQVGGEPVLRDEERAFVSGEPGGVGGLVVVRRVRIRDEDRWRGAADEFGNGAGSGSRYHQVGGGEQGGNVVTKGDVAGLGRAAI